MDIKEKMRFWNQEAIEALTIAGDLYRLGHYVQALFFGHLAIEKLLKAKIVGIIKNEPLYSHDLVLLSSYAKIKLNTEDLDLLARINVYNIRGRYQDYKKSLHKQATKKFTDRELIAIRKIFKRIK